LRLHERSLEFKLWFAIVSEALALATACKPSLTVGLLTLNIKLKLVLSTEFDYNNREP